MARKKLLFEDDARLALLRGVSALADAVAVTYGPRGRNVLYVRPEDKPTEDPGGLTITNDGVSIAERIDFADRGMQQGVEVARGAARVTNDEAGDGTTTVILLTREMLRFGIELMTAGVDPIAMRRGMDWAALRVIDDLRERQAIPIGVAEHLVQVATHAGKDPAIGELVGKAFDELGAEAVVRIEPGQTTEIEMEIVPGTQWQRGYLSPDMATDEITRDAVLEEPYIVFADMKFKHAHELLPICEKVAETGKPLFIVAKRVDGEALGLLRLNIRKGVLQSAAALPPDYALRRRRMLDDMAVMTGGTVLSEESGLTPETATLDDLGRADKVIAGRRKCTIVGGWGDPEEIASRRAAMHKEARETLLSFHERKFKEREARLAANLALFSVGAPTEAEITERRMRLDDAVCATRAALEEGIVAGGGTALLRAQRSLDDHGLSADEAAGVEVVRRALEMPVKLIADNAGFEGSAVAARVRELDEHEGFNAADGTYTDLIDAGVLDPVKVARLTIANSVSAAKTMLVSEALVLDLSRG